VEKWAFLVLCLAAFLSKEIRFRVPTKETILISFSFSPQLIHLPLVLYFFSFLIIIIIKTSTLPEPIHFGNNLNFLLVNIVYFSSLCIQGSTFSLVHRLMSSSDTICNSQSLPLTDIVYYGSLRIAVSLTILKRICQLLPINSYIL